MHRRIAALFAAAPAFTGNAVAMQVPPLALGTNHKPESTPSQSVGTDVILVHSRACAGGRRRAGGRSAGGASRSGATASPGSFNGNDFHQNVSSTRNLNANPRRNVNANANRNVTVNANRNVNFSGGSCCHGSYNSGPTRGGVAAGVAVGAMVGAAANSAASSQCQGPPPTYPPGYVSPPPYRGLSLKGHL